MDDPEKAVSQPMKVPSIDDRISGQDQSSVAPANGSSNEKLPALQSTVLLARPVLLRTLEGHTYSVYAASFSPDGRTVLTGSWDDTARLWDAATGRELARISIDSYVNDAAFSPDG